MPVYKKNRGWEVAEFTAGLHFTPPPPFSLLARPFYLWAVRLVMQSASHLLSLGMQLKADGNIGTYAGVWGGRICAVVSYLLSVFAYILKSKTQIYN